MGSYGSAHVRVWFAAPTLVALAACGDGASEIGVELQRTRSNTCAATVRGSAKPMNTYQIDVLVDNRDEPGGTCLECLDDQRCGLVEQRCLCGRDRAPSLENLKEALAGLRFSGLEQKVHCLRVMAVEVEQQQQQPEVETDCPCRESWIMLPEDSAVPMLPNPDRMCGVASQPLRLRPGVSFQVEMGCKDDFSWVETPEQANDATRCYGFPIAPP